MIGGVTEQSTKNEDSYADPKSIHGNYAARCAERIWAYFFKANLRRGPADLERSGPDRFCQILAICADQAVVPRLLQNRGGTKRIVTNRRLPWPRGVP